MLLLCRWNPQSPVRADQIVHVDTATPMMSVNTASGPSNIEKLGEDRWFADTHSYGILGCDDDHRESVANALIREIAVRTRDGDAGLI
ncbi:hypothetical protein [Nocardia sp. NRRL S-836]|uniref:hypothetical protein n=1 Tax=Nocardia sp. NRRL S-836 TaxID=1519492 RepID=UPI0006AF6EB6|nr:hypothetical protein [Nocardia sp. NRRL S-836]KOV77639.1 hypothetical protein ADL03_41585 [Nocardia sp. NRRL S-836]